MTIHPYAIIIQCQNQHDKLNLWYFFLVFYPVISLSYLPYIFQFSSGKFWIVVINERVFLRHSHLKWKIDGNSSFCSWSSNLHQMLNGRSICGAFAGSIVLWSWASFSQVDSMKWLIMKNPTCFEIILKCSLLLRASLLCLNIVF